MAFYIKDICYRKILGVIDIERLESGEILFKNILQDVFIALDSLGFKEEYIVKGAVALSLTFILI